MLQLAYFKELSQTEIAEQLDVPGARAESSYAAGFAALRDELGIER